jgi:hypothetical protein
MKLERTYALAVPLNCSLVIAAMLLSSPALGDDEKAGAAAAPPGVTAAAPAITESRREADALLKGMATYLAGLQSFTCTLRAGYDVVQPTGQKLEFGETRRVTMARPNRLRVEEIASNGERDLALFDGENVTVMKADSGVFAQAPQPGTVDDALVYFVRDLKLRMPLAILFTTRLPREIPTRVKTVDYVESTDIYGVTTDHIAGRTDSVDFQFWITEGPRPLPLRVVITYRNATGQPQFWANFSDWNVNPQLTKTTFQFTPPKGSHQIAFAVQVPRPANVQRPAAASEEVKP